MDGKIGESMEEEEEKLKKCMGRKGAQPLPGFFPTGKTPFPDFSPTILAPIMLLALDYCVPLTGFRYKYHPGRIAVKQSVMYVDNRPVITLYGNVVQFMN